MNSKKWILLAVAFVMIGGGAALIVGMKTHQKLGPPGVKTAPIPNSHNLEVLLPERVLDFSSEKVPTQQLVIDLLPKDTSFGQRRYTAPDGFSAQANVVLMGADRTSIHKPEFCLQGAGWAIDTEKSGIETVRIDGPEPYDLPVMKMFTTRKVEREGRTFILHGFYVFWFVAGDTYTAEHGQRMWSMAWELMTTGVLQRWAYVAYFSVCEPGNEEVTFDRMKKLIAASVPEFQTVSAQKKQMAASH